MHSLMLNLFQSSVAIQFSSMKGYFLIAANFTFTIVLCITIIHLINQNVVLKKVLFAK